MSNEKKGITVKIDADLHAEIKEYIESKGMTMAQFIEQAVDNELHPKFNENMEENNMGKMRTLAFQVDEELFQKVKDYLARNNISQKQFVIGLIEREIDRDLTERAELKATDNKPDEELDEEQDEAAYNEEIVEDEDEELTEDELTEDDIDDISGFGREVEGVQIAVMIREEGENGNGKQNPDHGAQTAAPGSQQTAHLGFVGRLGCAVVTHGTAPGHTAEEDTENTAHGVENVEVTQIVAVVGVEEAFAGCTCKK